MFIFTFSYIFYTAFIDDYLAPYPSDQKEVDKINRDNWCRACTSVSLFLCAFSYLTPTDYAFFHPMQRFWRVMSIISVIYFCFVIMMLHHRPEYGRKNILAFMDPTLDVELTKGFHTYDDNCELTWANLYDNFDHYYVVHWCNWFLTSFVIRDVWVCHMWHVIDELIELSW